MAVSVTPTNGTPLGGTSVTVTGSDFTAGTTVSFDGIGAATVFVNSTTLTATTPPHAPGAVDVTVTNVNGSDALLAAYWVDPEFDPDQKAFYYVRVLEIPTPRWTAYDAKFFGVDMPEGTAMQLQDRAYTSPVWYTP